jgi:hypothetical protein
MASIEDLDTAGACDTCGGPVEDLLALQPRMGDNVCEQCGALFGAARALLDNNILDEAVIIGTLAFAWSEGAWTVNPDDYGRFEFLAAVDGVPLLRLPDITTEAVTYEGSRVPKAVKINVYSRGVKPEKLAEFYERLLN